MTEGLGIPITATTETQYLDSMARSTDATTTAAADSASISSGVKRSRPKSQSKTSDSNSTTRLRAACDECRTKKLKCTGEQPACARCAREGITCVYSVQKRMGRPKKRARLSGEEEETERRETGADDGARSGERVLDVGSGSAQSAGVDEGDATELDTTMVFTPGGGLQPWLQVSEGGADGEQWQQEGGMQSTTSTNSESAVPSATHIPSLTPDSSNVDSPPNLHLPHDLHHTSAAHSHHNMRDSSTNLLLDPSLSTNNDLTIPGLNLGLPPNLLPSCACLSTMYLTLSSIQSSDPLTTPFPVVLHPLREALQTAASVLACETCPTRFITAVQNTQLLGTLLMITAERFSKVLAGLTTESQRAAEKGEKKRFRLADLNTSTAHLHTGGIGCAAAFSVSLDPDEWRALCKKVVRAEVFGPEEGNVCCESLVGVVEKMEDRQHQWHERPASKFVASQAEEGFFPRDKDGKPMGGPYMPKEDHVCHKFCKFTRKMVENYDWS